MKPRCPDCNRALKKTSHRTGASGTYETITGWWYCKHCNTMHEEVYDMPTDPDQYSHPAASAKFPEISKFNKRDVAKVSEINKELKLFFDYWDPLLAVKPIIHPNHVVFPIWHCAFCNHFLQLNRETRPLSEELSEQQIEAMRPTHCSEKMKLIVQSRDTVDPLYPSLEITPTMAHEIQTMTNMIANQHPDQAGYYALKRILQVLSSDIEFFEIRNILLPINRFLQDIDPDIRNQFINTWGFRSLVIVLRSFIDDRSFYSLIRDLQITLNHPSVEYYSMLIHWVNYSRTTDRFVSHTTFVSKFGLVINDIIHQLVSQNMASEVQWIREISWKIQFMHKNYLQVTAKIRNILQNMN